LQFVETKDWSFQDYELASGGFNAVFGLQRFESLSYLSFMLATPKLGATQETIASLTIQKKSINGSTLENDGSATSLTTSLIQVSTTANAVTYVLKQSLLTDELDEGVYQITLTNSYGQEFISQPIYLFTDGSSAGDFNDDFNDDFLI